MRERNHGGLVMTKRYIAGALCALAVCLAGCGDREPQRAVVAGVKPPDLAKLTEMKVQDVLMHPMAQGHVVQVEAKNGEHAGTVVPIIVGEREAAVLRMKLTRQSSIRPLTHDLALALVAKLGGTIKYVVVDDIRDNIFLARIYMTDAEGTLCSVDSRASDAIILAVATGVRLHFSGDVIKETGIKAADDGASSSAI